MPGTRARPVRCGCDLRLKLVRPTPADSMSSTAVGVKELGARPARAFPSAPLSCIINALESAATLGANADY